MPKHTWSSSITTDAGSASVDKIDLYAAKDVNIGGTSATEKGLQVGTGSVETITLAITVADIKSFYIRSTQPTRVRTNSEVTPAQTFELEANKALAWNDSDIPQPSANPLTTNITALYFYNEGSAVASVTASFLLKNEESQFS